MNLSRLGYLDNVLCVNDGSLDNSLEIIHNYKCQCIDYSRNMGKGYALKQGFIYAKDKNFNFVITLDSDLQHKPESINDFFITQNHENADMVIGYRRFKINTMPISRYLSNKLTSFIVSIICKKTILDSQSGYRLYNLELFNPDEIKSNRYQMETEIILNYVIKKAIISYVEIPIIYNNEISHISHLRDIINFIKIILERV
jgi:glycosyltransferase involved in cell wall biosynthesis